MRKRKPKQRYIMDDPRYNDPMVTQFVNNLMWEGKKSTSFTLFYNALELVKNRTNEDEHALWKKALNNVMPQVEVRSRRSEEQLSKYQLKLELKEKYLLE